jgi:hypothetical protein
MATSRPSARSQNRIASSYGSTATGMLAKFDDAEDLDQDTFVRCVGFTVNSSVNGKWC